MLRETPSKFKPRSSRLKKTAVLLIVAGIFLLRKKELSRKLKNLISNKKNFSFKKAFFALIATGLIFTSATLAAVKVFKQPSIKWTPEKIEITLFTGTSKSSSASFLSNKN